MVPEHLRFGGGAADSLISPIVAVWLLVAIVLVVVLPRRKAIMPFLIAFFTIPVGEVIVVGGVHLTALRILILAVLDEGSPFSAVTSTPEESTDRLGRDHLVAIRVLPYSPVSGTPALIQGLGVLLDTLGGYLAVRSLIPDGDAMQRTIKTLAIVCAILGACMIKSKSTISMYLVYWAESTRYRFSRDGRLRAGATLGCIPAGAFSGVLIPCLSGSGKNKNQGSPPSPGSLEPPRWYSPPPRVPRGWLLLGSLLGLATWRLRKNMRLIRWGIVVALSDFTWS